MKKAVSLPDDVFAGAERFAKRAGLSRSEVYSRALREYVARHGADEVTDSLNAVVENLPAEHDEFASRAAQRTLARSEW